MYVVLIHQRHRDRETDGWMTCNRNTVACTIVHRTLIINGDGGYGLLAAYIGGPVAQTEWLGLKAGGRLAPFCIHRVNSCNGSAMMTAL